MRADLHTHTVYSDGAHTPEELAAIAKKNGVELLAVTDHDNMEGADRKQRAIEGAGLLFTHGIEISAYLGCKVHVAGYACDPHCEAYRAYLQSRIDGSFLRAQDIIDKCRKIGISLSMEEVLAERQMQSAPIHTMHVARAIHKKGICTDAGEVYETLLCRGAPAYSDIGRPTPFDAISFIHAFGGIACLAHPGRIELDEGELKNLVDRMKECGLDGIECVYPSHTERETNYFFKLAKERSLFVTGGSDTHIEGAGRSVGSPVFEPSEELLERICPMGGK